jgi:CRP/FNR family cyclic AMP-dependent transcriptional regulator
MVGWPDQNAAATNPTQVKLNLTHEEIGQMIGTSRETVSRLFAGFKKQHLIQQNGCTLAIPDRVALESLITAESKTRDKGRPIPHRPSPFRKVPD